MSRLQLLSRRDKVQLKRKRVQLGLKTFPKSLDPVWSLKLAIKAFFMGHFRALLELLLLMLCASLARIAKHFIFRSKVVEKVEDMTLQEVCSLLKRFCFHSRISTLKNLILDRSEEELNSRFFFKRTIKIKLMLGSILGGQTAQKSLGRRKSIAIKKILATKLVRKDGIALQMLWIRLGKQ